MGKMSPEASLWLIAMALFFSGAVTSFHATPTEADSRVTHSSVLSILVGRIASDKDGRIFLTFVFIHSR